MNIGALRGAGSAVKGPEGENQEWWSGLWVSANVLIRLLKSLSRSGIFEKNWSLWLSYENGEMYNPSLPKPGWAAWTDFMGVGFPDSPHSHASPPHSVSLWVPSANSHDSGWCRLTSSCLFLRPPTLSCLPALPSIARPGFMPAHRPHFCSCTNTTKSSRLPGAGPVLHRRLRAHIESAAQLGLEPKTLGETSISWGIPHPPLFSLSCGPFLFIPRPIGRYLSPNWAISVLPYPSSRAALTNALGLDGWPNL